MNTDEFVAKVEAMRWANVQLYVAVVLKRIAHDPRFRV